MTQGPEDRLPTSEELAERKMRFLFALRSRGVTDSRVLTAMEKVDLSVLRDRGYVRLDKKRLVPEDKGRIVTAFLESFFTRYVEYDFTANLEEQLDLEQSSQRIAGRSEDFKEGVGAFLEKRSAKFKGR